MEDRAAKFIKNFSKGVQMFRENKEPDISIFVYIYARDPNHKSETHPDGAIRLEKFCNTSNYDDFWIQQDIKKFFLKGEEGGN